MAAKLCSVSLGISGISGDEEYFLPFSLARHLYFVRVQDLVLRDFSVLFPEDFDSTIYPETVNLFLSPEL